jgi:hypothetical protein
MSDGDLERVDMQKPGPDNDDRLAAWKERKGESS